MKRKGFTLIELLAVIVIMGILMFAAIPAVNRTIENARKDQFINTAQNYARAVETLWYAGELECTTDGGTTWTVATALSQEDYFVFFETNNSKYHSVSFSGLLQHGGKSPWGNRDVFGYVDIYPSDGRISIVVPFISDGVRMVNGCDWISSEELTRIDVSQYNSDCEFEQGEEYSMNHYCRRV